MKHAFFVLALLLAGPLGAADFRVSAQADRGEVELGEPFQLTVSLSSEGRFDFPPQLQAPAFEGFEVRGPMQMQSQSWVNGAVTEQRTLTWELTPLKAGERSLGPFRASAKDPKVGELVRTAPAVRVRVKRPRQAFVPPAPLPQATPSQPPLDEALRDIKADFGPPWRELVLIYGSFGALLGLLASAALRRPRVEPPVPIRRDPAQWALERLERALQGFDAGGAELYVRSVDALLREYLRQRLELWQEATLGECVAKAGRRLKLERRLEADALRARLEQLLYGRAAFEAADREGLHGGVRRLIVETEKTMDLGPRPAPELKRGRKRR